MDARLLEILACPVCKGPLKFQREAQVKDAEQRMRIAVADANAKAVAGENAAQAEIVRWMFDLCQQGYGIRRIAHHLEGEIGLHAGAHVEIAFGEQRPAAMRPLDATQIDGDFLFERGIDRFAQIMPQQHVFGRDRRVGLELEHPMAVLTLLRQQRSGRAVDGPLEPAGCRLGQIVDSETHGV